MTVRYSADLSQQLKPCKSKICKACGLYLNQPPVSEKGESPKVFWVGLSAVQFNEDEEKIPLSPFTPSGALIHSIQKPFTQEISFYKTNLVKCVPLRDEKIRYPVQHEMEKCFPNFEWELKELKPSIVFLLGKQVSTFVFKKFADIQPPLNDKFRYQPIEIRGIQFIPIHHPSYVLVYKRKYLSDYIRGIQNLFSLEASSFV